MKRHNKALENLSKAKEHFYENEVRRKDEIMRKRQELSDANAEITQLIKHSITFTASNTQVGHLPIPSDQS